VRCMLHITKHMHIHHIDTARTSVLLGYNTAVPIPPRSSARVLAYQPQPPAVAHRLGTSADMPPCHTTGYRRRSSGLIALLATLAPPINNLCRQAWQPSA
jgi:hypothetical protein